MSTPLLLVRADAGGAMGAGHVMRTLAVAQAWCLAGGCVTYAVYELPDALAQRLLDEGCRVERWDDGNPGGVDDGRRLRRMARAMGAEALIVDGYQFEAPFRREVSRAGIPSVLVHDYGVDTPLWLDFVLDQNAHATPSDYPLVEPSRRLLGLRWAMLRREFVEAPRPRREVLSLGPGKGDSPVRLLVTLGAGDPHDVTSRVIRGLAGVEHPLVVRVVVGAANPHLDIVQRAAEASPHRVEVLHNVTDMPGHMAWADAAVAAAGSTSWELAWRGVPWLTVAIADNQRPILAELERREMAVALGWHEDVTEADVATSLERLLGGGQGSPPQRPSRGRRIGSDDTFSPLDGRGAERLVALLRGQG